jgi:hypothetical protein
LLEQENSQAKEGKAMRMNKEASMKYVKWVKLLETPGTLSAEVIAGRLKSEGIPAWVWQQGAGRAMGLTYGPMGRGHVMVPEELLEEAERILDTEVAPDSAAEETWPESDSDSSEADDGREWLSKGVLALTALAISPLGVAAAWLVTKLAGQDDRFSAPCPDCRIWADLNEQEEAQGWFICPNCDRKISFK